MPIITHTNFPLYIPVDTMYIKFYNALDQQGLEAGRGRVPKPRRLTAGRHGTRQLVVAGGKATAAPPFTLSVSQRETSLGLLLSLPSH